MPQVVQEEWGRDLISSWNKHGWWQAQQRVGRKISRIIGAAADEVLVADSTSINLFKVVAAALDLHPGKILVSGAQVPMADLVRTVLLMYTFGFTGC